MSHPSTDMSVDDMSAIYLSQADVDNLLTDNSPDSRINILDKISTHYGKGTFKQQELMFAEQIFRVIMRDTELRVRKTLSDRIKDFDNIPRDIILHIAHDVEQVAIPIIESSNVLSDADLIKIIESSREVSKLIAVSNRDHVSSRVSAALVDTHYPQVVKSLLNNDSATISTTNYEQILRDFSHEEAITAAMVDRAGLPVSIVEKLVDIVSDAVAGELKERYQIDTQPIQQTARESITVDLMTFMKSDEEVENTVKQMIAFNRLSPSIILSSLCHGHINFFEIALAQKADIPKSNARKLIHDKGPLGFEALYRKTGLPDSMYEAIKLVLRVVQSLKEEKVTPATSNYNNIMVERILQRAGDREIENLPYIIALIRQGK